MDVESAYALPVPTRTGYTFTGWYLGDTLISNGDPVRITGDSTFVAHWAASQYSIHLDPNGGNVSPMVVEIAAGGAYTLPVPTWTGYTFAGWYLGDAQVSEDSAVQLPPGCTLTAHWQANHYTIWYNPNGGTSDAEGEITVPTKPFLLERCQLCEYDQDVTLLNCPYTRRGYQFRGWSMDPNADSGYEAGSTVRNLTSEPNGAVILYATWGNTAEIVDPKPGIVCGVMPTTYAAAAPVDELVVYTKTYTYDLAGNRTSFTLTKNGWTVQSVTYTYDNLNRLSTVSENGSLQATYTYDANGNRASLTYTNGTQETYTYNKANWITRLENKKGNVVLSSFRYTYYASGSQRSETDHTGKVTRYTYDGLGRLTEERETDGLTVNYTYDLAGNRSQMAVTGPEVYTTRYTYDANNRLLTEAKTENGETVTTAYTYDANGNTLTKVTPAHGEEEASSTVYSYNGFNQLVDLTIDGTTVAYAYNAQGIRTAKRVNHLRTAFLIDGGNVVAEVQNNAVTDTYLRGVNLIRRENGVATEYYLFNAHGDVVTTTNPNGTINKSYDYDAFGNEKDLDPLDTNPFRYCGEYLDTETGSYYLRARYYDPTIGRFTQEDTHWDTANMIYGDNPQKINEQEDKLGLKTYTHVPQITAVMQRGNLYVYAMNSPVAWYDATGKLGLLSTLLIGAAVNVATTFIAAKITGQEYTWADAGAAALSGAAAAVDKPFFRFLGGVAAGAYTAYNAYQSGASIGEALLDGVISGTVTVFSVTNTTRAITKLKVDTAIGVVADVTFGVGSNGAAAAYHSGITNAAASKKTANKTKSASTNASKKQNTFQDKTRVVPKAPSKSRGGGGGTTRVAMLY